MIDRKFVRPHVQARLAAGPMGPHVEGLVESLREEKYPPRTIRLRVRTADFLGVWLQRRGLGLADLDETVADAYVAAQGRRWCARRARGVRPAPAGGVLKILAFLRARGVVPPFAPVARSEWFQDFDGYLDRVAGLSAGTRRIYGRYATRFVARRFGGEAPDWPRITASDLVDFVLRETSSLKPSGCRAPVTATRAFLRFLAVRGLVREGLAAAIPPVREWKHARLPRHLTADQVAAVLDSCSETTTVGRRDRAILALLARLGLRAGEVVGLDLEDIDWARSQLRVRASKSGKERVLPLPHDVGVAIVAYLRTERPAAIQRAVFLRATPPHRRLGNSSTVSAVAKRHLRLAGIPAGAAHALRHTAATLMVRRGVTFKEVADILGHARLETTAIYAKLDLEALARVALSWPGGAP